MTERLATEIDAVIAERAAAWGVAVERARQVFVADPETSAAIYEEALRRSGERDTRWHFEGTYGGDGHTYPVGDLIEHELTEDCICGPEVEPVERGDGSFGWLYSHHSLDGRATEVGK